MKLCIVSDSHDRADPLALAVQRAKAQGAEVVTQSPAEFTQFFTTERNRWAKVVAEAGVRLD